MRAFVAVFPPPGVREALVRAAQGLPVSGAVRWIPAANVHLTLKFLGDIAQEDLVRVRESLALVSARHGPFEAATSGFGAFPSSRRARILWAGIGEGSEELRDLASDVEECLQPLGFKAEQRPYKPHLTLGRARGRPVSLETAEALPPNLRFRVHGMELVRSVLGSSGATYSTIKTYPFSESSE